VPVPLHGVGSSRVKGGGHAGETLTESCISVTSVGDVYSSVRMGCGFD
jgi:hypothetical protein